MSRVELYASCCANIHVMPEMRGVALLQRHAHHLQLHTVSAFVRADVCLYKPRVHSHNNARAPSVRTYKHVRMVVWYLQAGHACVCRCVHAWYPRHTITDLHIAHTHSRAAIKQRTQCKLLLDKYEDMDLHMHV